MLAHTLFRYLLLALLSQLAILTSPASATEHTPRVTFINPGYADKGFWKAVTDTMQAAAKQLGFELQVHYADRQWPAMVKNAEKVINSPEKTDFLILVNEHQQAVDLLKDANKSGIPTLMLLNTLTEQQIESCGLPRKDIKHWLGSLIPNNELAGYEMATSLLGDTDSNSAKLPLLTLAGDNVTPASMYRLNGLDKALAEHSRLAELRRISVNWSHDEAYQRTRLWLDSGNQLSAVWAANDPIALGAIKAIKEQGLSPGKDVLVSGLNWSPEAVSAVLDNEMTLTHGGHFLAGAWAIVLLYDYINGYDFQDIGTQLSFPMTAINAGNARRYLQLFGEGDWSKVNFGKFTRKQRGVRSHYEFTLQKLLEFADHTEH